MESEHTKRLEDLTIMELDSIEEYDKPNVFTMYKEDSEATIELVMKKVAVEKRTISGAINAIEREFNINLQND